MRKFTILIVVLALFNLNSNVFAQWQTNGNDVYYDNGKVGIGINAPSDNLHVLGTSLPVLKVESNTTSNGILRLKGGGTGSLNWNIYSTGSGASDGVGKLVFGDGIHGDGTGVQQRLVIDNTGNLGIGILNPQYKLDIDGNVNLSSGNNFLINGVPISSGSSLWSSSGSNLYYNSGNIGIGTDTPSDNLHVLGSSLPVLKVESNTTSNGILRLKGGGSGSLNWNIYSTGSGATESAGKLVFGDGIHGDGTGVEARMLIDNNGNIGIGTGYSEVSEKLEINGNILIKENNALILTSPNGTEYKITVDDSGNLTTSEVTGTKSMTIETDIDIFPNPTTNLVNIRINEQNVNETDIEIFSISGSMVFMRKYNSNSFSVNISDLKRGTYILKLKDREGNLIKTQKIIKQ